jgi:hypothetical protein
MKALVWGITSLLVPLGAQARLCSIPNAGSDVDGAKIIIRGTGHGVAPFGLTGTDADPRYVLVKVDRVISGSLMAPYIFANAPCAMGITNGPMLVFLTGGSFGVYQTVGDSGILAAAEKAPAVTSADPREAVVAELLEAVKVPSLRTEALTQLNSLSPQIAAKAAEEAVADKDPQVRSTANLVLASSGSTDAVHRIVQTLLSDEMNVDYPNDWTDLRYSSDIAKLNFIIRQGMALEHLKGDQIKAALPLLQHRNHRVRRSAAYGLRQAATPALIPELLKALGDSDSDVKYNAMMGICMMANRPGTCPATMLFKRNEDKYIAMAKDMAKNLRRGTK